MAAFSWPALLTPQDFGFMPDNPDRSGGTGLAGGEQFVVSPGGRWRAGGVFPIKNKNQVLALRALRSSLIGRTNTVDVPNFDGKRLSWPVEVFAGNSTGIVLTPTVTRNRRLDGTAYEDAAIPAASEINATVNADAAFRATTIAINKTQGGTIRAGQQFGIGARLFEIATIVSVAGAVTTVTFWPPLRTAVPATTVVKFTRPVCRMRLADPGQLLPELQLMRFAIDLRIDFVESNWG